MSHFIGLRGIQVLLLVVFALRRVDERLRARLVLVAAIGYTGLLVLAIWQTARGQSLWSSFFLDGLPHCPQWCWVDANFEGGATRMNVLQYVADRWDRLSLQAFLHVSAVVQCTVLATVLGVVIGVAVYRSPIGSALATALASTILTIPSFALLALLIPVFGLGADTTVVALVLYALLPIVRNTIVGLAGVDPAVSDAAKGIGMSRFGVLARVELRLAWPAILAGMRVATQMLMGIAVIAAYAKGPGLGSEVFSGLANAGSANALNQALTGTIGVVVLALVLDGIYVLVNRFTVSRGVRG